jgi:hypothetical protein
MAGAPVTTSDREELAAETAPRTTEEFVAL